MDDIQFLQQLIQVNSSNPPGNELPVAQLIAERAKQMGFDPKITTWEGKRSNLQITWPGRSRGKKLLICGHMDTVSPGEMTWDYAPYSATIVGERLYGRGASDMKSGLAAMYLAMEALFREGAVLTGELVFLATAGEEVDCCGAKQYLEANRDLDVDAMIIGEPTNEKIVVGHKGALWLDIITYGKTAHGAMPEQGVNAIIQMTKVIDQLEQVGLHWQYSHPILGQSSSAVTKIGGGIQTNVIPDRCFLHVDIRSVPPQAHSELVEQLRSCLDRLATEEKDFSYDLRILLDRTSIMTDPDSEIIQLALSIQEREQKNRNKSTLHTDTNRNVEHEQNMAYYGVSYYTDASILNAEGTIPTLIYGPGDEKLAHQPNEWVSISAYQRSIAFYKELISSFLSR